MSRRWKTGWGGDSPDRQPRDWRGPRQDSAFRPRLAHAARGVEDQRRSERTCLGDYLAEYRALYDPLDGWKGIGRRIESILMLDFELGKNRDSVDALVMLASGSRLEPDEIAQLE
jgi:hypothetical protein